MSFRAAAVGLVALLMFPFGTLAASPKTSNSPGTIIGQVQQPCGAASAAGVLIFIPGRSFVAITGPTGTFELSSVPVGTYTVRIEYSNRAYQQTSVVVTSGQTTNVGLVSVDNFSSDANNCGGCGNVCPANNGTPVCTNGQCVGSCSLDGQCASTSYCNSGICTPKQPNGNTCSRAAECQSGTCTGGICTPPTTTCTSDSQCPSTSYCIITTGVCVIKKSPGNSCSAANECASGVCTSGICQ